LQLLQRLAWLVLSWPRCKLLMRQPHQHLG
jgi:hypothetical protein